MNEQAWTETGLRTALADLEARGVLYVNYSSDQREKASKLKTLLDYASARGQTLTASDRGGYWAIELFTESRR